MGHTESRTPIFKLKKASHLLHLKGPPYPSNANYPIGSYTNAKQNPKCLDSRAGGIPRSAIDGIFISSAVLMLSQFACAFKRNTLFVGKSFIARNTLYPLKGGIRRARSRSFDPPAQFLAVKVRVIPFLIWRLGFGSEFVKRARWGPSN